MCTPTCGPSHPRSASDSESLSAVDSCTGTGAAVDAAGAAGPGNADCRLYRDGFGFCLPGSRTMCQIALPVHYLAGCSHWMMSAKRGTEYERQ